MSKKKYIACLFIISLISVMGCEMAKVADQDPPIDYSGPKIRVIVSPIELKTKQGDLDCNVITEQLVTALTSTNVFVVAVDNNANLQNVQYRIKTIITEYETNDVCINKAMSSSSKSTSSGSNVISAGLNTITSGLNSVIDTFKFNKNFIAMSIHLVDPNTGDIVNSRRIEANPKDFNGCRNVISGSSKTPIQKATWACVYKASIWAANSVVGNEKASKKSHLFSKDSLIDKSQ